MQQMGLSNAELQAYHRALRTHRTVTLTVAVLDLAGNPITSITPVVLDGQVVVDLDAEVTRVATVSFLDPSHSLQFDSESPDDGALYADRMLRILYTVNVPELGRHVSCPVFTGPVVKFERKGDVVDVEAHGKERLALGSTWRPYTVKKGAKKVDAIRDILEDRAGETRFAFPTVATRMPTALSLDRFGPPWKPARKIAQSMNRQLFYPGNGTCTLRTWPGRPLFTFDTGDEGLVTSDLAVSNTMQDFANLVVVIGAKPKGAKTRVRATAQAPAGHPLSPSRLGRNGVPRYVVRKIEDSNVRSVQEASRRARRILEDSLRSSVQVAFDAIPIPHLDAGDLVQVATEDATVQFRMRQFTIPLGAEGAPTMSVGYLKALPAKKRRLRR